ncbi:MAG: hypothetical protein JWO37_4109 [Acidimicrobiales bacterium]|nr:hypothetical protein [Acidimicrobiales bacterium]
MELIKPFKPFCCFLLFAFSFQFAKAQTFAEWFSQKKTQIKYLTQQIAALNACETSLKQGYNMLHSEWSAIGNFKNGEFGLHQDYYSSLRQVNPLVKSSTDLPTIQAEQQSIISQFNSVQHLSGLSASEQTYIRLVQQNVFNQCAKDLNDLQAVLSSGELVMTDDERIKRINQLTAAIKDKYLFTCSFCVQIRLLTIQRNQDHQSIQTLNQLYGIN